MREIAPACARARACVCVGVMLRDSKLPRGISPGQPHYPVGGGGGPRAATVSAWKKSARGEYSVLIPKSTNKNWITGLFYNM